MKLNNLHIKDGIGLESGETLPEINIAYSTSGKLNSNKDNVVWVFHALTANSNPFEWWSGLFGDNKFFKPDEHFIICANVLGGCYGTTGPESMETPSEFKGLNFPLITVKDIVNAHLKLAKHLGISSVKYAIGGSFGGYQAFEFSLSDITVEKLIVVASGCYESPWNIAIHETQRMAILSDPSITSVNGGKKGLETARGIGLLTYRTPSSFNSSQPRTQNQLKGFAASSYIRYQGKKLSKRFSPHSYFTLLHCLDTHDLGRGRENLNEALKEIKAKTLCIGINEDLLANPRLLRTCSELIPNGSYVEINSDFGHDGFLLETEKLNQVFKRNFN